MARPTTTIKIYNIIIYNYLSLVCLSVGFQKHSSYNPMLGYLGSTLPNVPFFLAIKLFVVAGAKCL